MATTDDLIVSIRADVTQLQRSLTQIDNNLRNTQGSANAAGSAIRSALGHLLGLAGVVEGLRKLVEVNREFGILKAGLETATGSIDAATEAFGALQQFAATTPYSLQQAVDGFTKLVNLGLTPSERALQSYGDTSAALGKDLSQMIEAVADAATGEFERLKEFGIKAKNQGDTIAFTFKGTTQTVQNNSAAIEEYLIKLGEVNFDGAMKKRMDSLDGAISNLSDSWDALFYQIGQAGATDALKSSFGIITEQISKLSSIFSTINPRDFEKALHDAGMAAEFLAGVIATRLVVSITNSTAAMIKEVVAAQNVRLQTLAQAQADAAAAGVAARRSLAEKELAATELVRTRAEAQLAIAAHQTALADAERANMDARLAAGTQFAAAADLQRTFAAQRVAAAQQAVVTTANAVAVATSRATTASAANTAAINAQTAATERLGAAQAAANIILRSAGGILTALGGPLGATITLLGIGATAWYVFGDNAESAADKAARAMKRLSAREKLDDSDIRGLVDRLKEVDAAIANRKSGGRLGSNKSVEELKREKANLEKQIADAQFERTLDDLVSGLPSEDRLAKYGNKPQQQPQTNSNDKKKLDELKKASAAYLNQLEESAMSEMALDGKHFNESLKQLKSYLDAGVISRSAYQKGVLDLNTAFNNKLIEQVLEQTAQEQEALLQRQQQEDDYRTRRMQSIQDELKSIQEGGLSELELMDKQHAEKMAKLEKLMLGEEQFKGELREAALQAEQQYQARRLDMILGTGNKMTELQRAFHKGNLQGALAFFAADFGGFSAHSRKMFELTKAAALANAAVSIPETVISAAKEGTRIGGWPLGAAMGAAALASQLGQLRAIQSATFGGGGSSGGGGAGGSAGAGAQSAQQPQQQPLQQRFVNIGLYGSDNTMYSKESVRDLITRINAEVKDGAVLRVN